MKILGIETSCDETAVSIIEATGTTPADFRFDTLGDTIHSQAEKHAEYGGVYPTLAKREHAKNFVPVLTSALKEASLLEENTNELPAGLLGELKMLLERESELFEQLSRFLNTHSKPDIDAIAVTAGPGLEPALWVGINATRALSLAWNIPLVSTNHMEGHIIISSLEDDHISNSLSFPALALLISGGHTEIILMHNWMQYEKIGETRDDAVGEAFDKVARLLDLPYPGGPALSKLAAEHRATDAEDTIQFPRPMMNDGSLDFSFSGLKTAVRVYLEKNPLKDESGKQAIARAFEDAVVDVLTAKVRVALDMHGAQTLIVGGGVSANTAIRESLKENLPGIALLLPEHARATDNALMIALAGYFHAIKDEYTQSSDIRAEGTRQL